MMKILIIIFVLLLSGCYTAPVLVTKGITGMNRLRSIADRLGSNSVPIKIKPDKGMIIIEPLYSDVPWQIINYTNAELNTLLRQSMDLGTDGSSTCQTNVKIMNMAHKIKPLGMGVDLVHVEGDFHVINACLSINCEVHTEYSTDSYFYLNSGGDNSHYSEAIVGVILKAVVAAQSCSANGGN